LEVVGSAVADPFATVINSGGTLEIGSDYTLSDQNQLALTNTHH